MAETSSGKRKPRSPQFNMIVPDGFLEEIEEWRASQRPVPSRTAAIVELCRRAILAEKLAQSDRK
jgi:hypothetical protein